jgi:hypothetical protein
MITSALAAASATLAVPAPDSARRSSAANGGYAGALTNIEPNA